MKIGENLDMRGNNIENCPSLVDIDDTIISNGKTWSSEKISKINVSDAKKVDSKPTYSDGTITYVKDGTSYTTTNSKQWFYYLENGRLKQTIFIDGEELTIDGSSVDLSEYIKKTSIATTLDRSCTNEQVAGAKIVYNLIGNENKRGYVFNNPTYRGNKWNRVFKVNSLLYCNSGFLTVVVYSSGLCQIASFLISKNFNRLNIKQINCGGYNGSEGKSRPIKVRIIGNETSSISFLEIYVSGTISTDVITTYMPLHCNSIEVLNEEGSIPTGMFACEMTATHDTYDTATYTSILK